MKILPTMTKHNAIAPLAQNKTNTHTTQKDINSVSFKRIDFAAAKIIENRIAQRGISANVNGNEFVAECYEKVIKLFEQLFKKSYLPAFVGTERLENNSYLGVYSEHCDSINVNKNLDTSVYYDMETLKESTKRAHNNLLLPNWASSAHPAHTFVHEFSHAAHWHHLEEKQGYNGAKRVWYGLEGTRIPTSIGRLIAKFKISQYAIGTKEKCDMCEFLAERMAKDVCAGLTDDMWVKYKDIDVKYDDIFNRKWNYRYSSPQSYIDYFTQQVWNGDIEGAKRVGDDANEYLAELESQKVAPAIEIASSVVETVIPGGFLLSKLFKNISENITNKLDDRNKLKLNG